MKSRKAGQEMLVLKMDCIHPAMNTVLVLSYRVEYLKEEQEACLRIRAVCGKMSLRIDSVDILKNCIARSLVVDRQRALIPLSCSSS